MLYLNQIELRYMVGSRYLFSQKTILVDFKSLRFS